MYGCHYPWQLQQISRNLSSAHVSFDACAAKPMLGRKQELNLQILQITDGLLMVLAFWIAWALRVFGGDTFVFGNKPIGAFSEFQWLLFVILPFGPIVLEVQGFYSHPLQKTLGKSLIQIARSIFWLGLIIAACAYFLKLNVPSRAVMPLFVVITTVILLLREHLSLVYYRERSRSQDLRERVIIAGTPGDIHELRHAFTPEQVMEIQVVAEFNLESQPIAEFIEALHEHSVNRVIFAGSHTQLHALQEAIAACEIEGVEAWLAADFIRTSIARADFDVFGNRPMLVFRTTPDLSWALAIKGLIDRVGALFALVLTSWLLLGIALGIKLTSPGPIFFRQQRAGKNGRPFTMFKFRSMHSDAEMRQAELAAFNQMEGPVFKIDKDPRVTGFGKFLRQTSLDEFPQLYNVLKGEMSLVGPRPLPIYEVEQFASTAQRRRLSMKPGLTCLWQISGRNRIKNFDDWVQLDLRYIDNWSLMLDLEILLKTIPVVIIGFGAR
jgi:exopolysaccharide biosynthesis polyprenyl glycosylphosphotransferase